MSNSANVIELSAHRKAKTPPQQPLPQQEPWHAGEALWILQEANGLGDPFFLNDWEFRFVTSIATLPDLSPKQERCLIAIGDRIEAALKEQEQAQQQPPTSPPAA
jgi:hypothetical protein